MRESDTRDTIRVAARAYEEALPPQQRKQLGQYFTGLPLGKLLAHLALDSETRTILDPMAGHGDLLDATWEAATERCIKLDRLDGIE
ncbi:MAG: N-6 DNA methylase, partial [Candidatus Acidiferrales bacterium]